MYVYFMFKMYVCYACCSIRAVLETQEVASLDLQSPAVGNAYSTELYLSYQPALTTVIKQVV